MMSRVKGKIASSIAGSPFRYVGLALLVGLLVAGAAGAALYLSEASERSELEAQLDDESALREQAEVDREEAELQADAITDRRDEIISDARANAEQIRTRAESKLARTKRQLGRTKRRLGTARSELDSVQGSISEARRVKRLSSIPGEGMWQADVDFIPGTYRSLGGSNCYWATLNGADTSNIGNNGLGPGPQIVAIGTPYFETQGCAKWSRIGD